ncbi:MAG: hypothetical protein IPK97_06425 [Ahniella sp.]|nr:hypothetical protein [Ahniella sp.]
MDTVTRDILSRLRWREWIAKGVLLGLLGSATAGLLLLFLRMELWFEQWPMLRGTGWWVYLGLGVLTTTSLVLTLVRHRYARPSLLISAALILLFETFLFGVGFHLARVPIATALAWWASSVLPPRP